MEASECWVCLEATDPGGVATAPTGCACRGSAGHAHPSCLIAAAKHKPNAKARHLAWMYCPTCNQSYAGPMEMGLARARWDLHRDAPEADNERLQAMGYQGLALSKSGDAVRATPIYEKLVSIMRRTHGAGHVETVQHMVNLASMRAHMGEHAATIPLLEEALSALNAIEGVTYQSDPKTCLLTMRCMSMLSAVYCRMRQFGIARLCGELATHGLREAGTSVNMNAAIVLTVNAIGNLGACLTDAGDYAGGLALHEESATMARRVFGEANPITQRAVEKCKWSKAQSIGCPPGACALGSLVGLKGRPDLNGRKAHVVGFGNGRYRVHLCLPEATAKLLGVKTVYSPRLQSSKFIGIKPANLMLVAGTARNPYHCTRSSVIHPMAVPY